MAETLTGQARDVQWMFLSGLSEQEQRLLIALLTKVIEHVEQSRSDTPTQAEEQR